MEKHIIVSDLGLISYRDAYDLQMQSLSKVAQQGVGSLLLCEHPATITCGRLSDKKNLLFDEAYYHQHDIDVMAINRGGDVTLHAPGQLVVYPILDLNCIGRDLHAYLHKLEEVGIDLLVDFDILANRQVGKTGVWVGDKKVMSCGIGVKKWISFHGMAINIKTDLNLFKFIRPCGLDVTMTSVRALKPELDIDMAAVKDSVIESFQRVFQLKFLKAKNKE